MRKYKSVQTYNKLQSIKAGQPDIYLSEFQEIDKKFDDLCGKAKAELFPEDLKLDNIKHVSKQQQQQLNKDVGDNFSNLVDRDMKTQLKKNMESNQVNPLVDMFGNALIATVFQSLLVKTVENIWNIKIKVDSDIPISSNVMKQFDISVLTINALKTKEEKQQYILKQMEKKIDELLKDQLKDIKAHQKISDDYLQEHKQKQKPKNSKEDDYFPWLQLKTKYSSLKKRLRAQIIEKINEYDNLKKISETLERKQDLRQSGQYNLAKKQHTDIDSVNLTSTKEIFNNMYTYGNPKTQQFLSRLGLGSEKQQTSSLLKKKKANDNTQDSFDYENNIIDINKKEDEGEKEELKNQQFSMYFYLNRKGLKKDQLMEQQFPKWKDDEGVNLVNQHGEKISENEMLNNENFKFWNEQKEFQFQIQRHEKQSLYNKEVSSSSWNDIGFLPFVQKYVIEMKKSMQRDHLLDKYCDGIKLTDDEFKFMANTSELLNQCLDRKFMQSAANSIEPSIIENMELGLAEEIIKNYEEIQIAIKQSRQQYINEKRKHTAEKFKILDIQFQKKKMREANLHFQNRYRKMLRTLVTRLERDGRFKEQPPKDVIGAKTVHKFLTGEIDEYTMVRNIKRLHVGDLKEHDDSQDEEVIQMKLREKEIEEKKEKLSKLAQPITRTGKSVQKQITRHVYHPSSKLFVNPRKEDDEFNQEEEMSDFKKKQIQDKLKLNKSISDQYQLHLKSNSQLRNPYNFIKYNSGGPIKPIRSEPFFNPQEHYKPMKVSPYELSKIIMIQKNVRSQLLKKHFKDTKNKKLSNLREEYKFKINRLQWPDVRIKLQGENGNISDLQVLTKKDEKEQKEKLKQQQEEQEKQDEIEKKKKIQKQQSIQQGINESQKRQGKNSVFINIEENQSFLHTNSSMKGRPSTAINRASLKPLELSYVQQERNNTNKSKNRPTSGLFGHRIQTASANKSSHTQSRYSQQNLVSYGNHQAMLLDEIQNIIMQQKEEEEMSQQVILKRKKLFEAAKKNSFWIVKTAGFPYNAKDLNSRDKDGNTALHYCTKFANIEFMEWLLSSGADSNARNKKLNTPMHVAFQTNKVDVINILINYGGDLNSLNYKYSTPLIYGNERVLNILGVTKGTKKVNQEDIEFDNNSMLRCNKRILDTTADTFQEQDNQQNYSVIYENPSHQPTTTHKSMNSNNNNAILAKGGGNSHQTPRLSMNQNNISRKQSSMVSEFKK